MPGGTKTQRGLTLGELLLALGVLVVFMAITIAIYSRARTGSMEDADVARMRQVYVALSIYQQDNNEAPSLNLLGIRSDLGGDAPLLSDSDPWAAYQARKFPIDPEAPRKNLASPVRISYSYLLDFVGPELNRPKDWKADLFDPRVGLLSCSWHGAITQTGAPFTATLSGPVLRINTNGMLYRLKDRDGTGEMGDWEALFYKR